MVRPDHRPPHVRGREGRPLGRGVRRSGQPGPQLFLQLVDDRGQDARRVVRLRGHDAEAFHGQQVPVDVGFLIEVESAGEVFQVSHVRQVRLREPQYGEPAGHGVAAHAARDDLQGEIRPVAQTEQVAELIMQDLLAADRPPQRRLLDDGPQLEPPFGEPALPFLSQDDMPFASPMGMSQTARTAAV